MDVHLHRRINKTKFTKLVKIENLNLDLDHLSLFKVQVQSKKYKNMFL